MAPASLVRKAQDLSRRIRAVLELLPKDDPLQLANNVKPAPAFLFEMVVLHQLLATTRDEGWTLSVVGGEKTHRFARSPGKKKNFTHVRITRNGESFQVVHGTQIVDRYSQPRAPDLSLQVHNSPLEPCKEHLVAIWDVKLRGTSAKPTDKRISDPEFRSFLSVVSWLEVPRPGNQDDALASLPAAFRVRGLITNGLRPSEPDALFLNEGISIVEHFTSAQTPCHPTREAHFPGQTSKSA